MDQKQEIINFEEAFDDIDWIVKIAHRWTDHQNGGYNEWLNDRYENIKNTLHKLEIEHNTLWMIFDRLNADPNMNTTDIGLDGFVFMAKEMARKDK